MEKIYICKFCGKELNNAGNLKRHERACQLNPNRVITNSKRSNFVCSFCGKIFENYPFSNFQRHEIYCKNNPNRKEYKKLSQETKQKIREYHKNNPYHVSEELKKNLSKIAKERHLGGYVEGSGRGIKGWYKGYWCDSTYELAYLIYCLDHNISIQRNLERFEYVYNNKIYKYIPDFIVEGQLVEIKGYKTPLVDIKLQAVNKPIKILYGKDLDFVFDYIKDKYNKVKDKNIQDLYDNIKNPVKTKIDVKKEKVKRVINKKKKVCSCCGKDLYNKNKTGLCCNCLKEKKRKEYFIPSKQELLDNLLKTNNLTELRKIYGVGDPTIRHWLQRYELPYKMLDIKELKINSVVGGINPEIPHFNPAWPSGKALDC